MIASTDSCNNSPKSKLQISFLDLVPKIQTHAAIYFRGIRCPAKKADKVAETVALAWRWFLTLTRQGKDASQFVMVFAFTVARSVKCGRRLAGMEPARDVMSERCQQRHNFTVESLPSSTPSPHENLFSQPHGQQRQDAFEERLRDNTITPIPDQAAFRIDFPAWLQTLTPRERRLIRGMARNERTKDLSKEFELSPGRISQLRSEFHQGWTKFVGDTDDGQGTPYSGR